MVVVEEVGWMERWWRGEMVVNACARACVGEEVVMVVGWGGLGVVVGGRDATPPEIRRSLSKM